MLSLALQDLQVQVETLQEKLKDAELALSAGASGNSLEAAPKKQGKLSVVIPEIAYL